MSLMKELALEVKDRNVNAALRTTIQNESIRTALDAYAQPYRELMSYYKCAIMEVETKFKVLNEEMSISYDKNPIEAIKTRLKSPDSIIGKLNRKGLPLSVESIEANLNDVAGVRIIVTHPSEIYKLADSFLSQDDIVLIECKDYIKNPKPNGYRSLHLIVETPIYLKEQKKMMRVEVQMRTISMDFWASLEHKIYYKKNLPEFEFLERELKECAEQSAMLDLRMENLAKLAEEMKSE